MTLNDLEWSFCVKIWFELGIQWVGVLAFGENCSEIYRATHRLSAAKNVGVNEEPLSGFIVQYNNCGLECEGSEDTASEISENPHLRPPHSHLMPSL